MSAVPRPREPAAAGFGAAHDLASAHAAFRSWMFEQALPFWGTVGHDGLGRGAREHLALDGSPMPVPYKRMRVQARQIYAFSHAALLGWSGGEALARDGYRFITSLGERTDGGWVRRLSAAGDAVLDGAVDLYDQAFVLFALAWYARLTGEDEPLARARRTVAHIRGEMAQAPGGFLNAAPPEPGPRQQNPHMHLLEATLALHATSGEAAFLDLAHELVALFRTRLFDPRTGTLGEFFAEDWSPAAGEAGDHVEPGHHFEWVWLLSEYERVAPGRLGNEAEALYAFALAKGTERATGLVFDVVSRDGRLRDGSARLWPQTEAIKAHAAVIRGGRDAEADLAGCVRNLGRFFGPAPAGAWIDHLDPQGATKSDKIPTSSFYHVFMAYAELDRLHAELRLAEETAA